MLLAFDDFATLLPLFLLPWRDAAIAALIRHC